MCQYCLRHFVSQIHTIHLQDEYYCLHITDEETSSGGVSHFLKTSHLLKGRDKTLTQSHLFIHSPIPGNVFLPAHTPFFQLCCFSVIFCVNKYKKIKEVGFCTFAILKIIDYKGKNRSDLVLKTGQMMSRRNQCFSTFSFSKYSLFHKINQGVPEREVEEVYSLHPLPICFSLIFLGSII